MIAAYVAPEKPGQKADLQGGLAAKLPIYQPASYRKPEVGGFGQARSAGDGVCCSCRRILNIRPRLDPVSPSLLPAYRGPGINWPIIKGETGPGVDLLSPTRA